MMVQCAAVKQAGGSFHWAHTRRSSPTTAATMGARHAQAPSLPRARRWRRRCTRPYSISCITVTPVMQEMAHRRRAKHSVASCGITFKQETL